jgi:hypothetical protein
VCAGENVKEAGKGLRLPRPDEPGSENYMERERLLREIGCRFDPAHSDGPRTKAKMMASKFIRASVRHFPGNRTTPAKRGTSAGVARSFRHKRSSHGDISRAIDTMMEDVDATAAMELPAQHRPTRSVRRNLRDAQGVTAPRPASAANAGAAGGRTARDDCGSLAESMGLAAIRESELAKELAATKVDSVALVGTVERLQRELTQKTLEIERLGEQARKLQADLHASDAKYVQQLADLKQQLMDATGSFCPLSASMLHTNLRRRCRQYTSFPSARGFDAWVDCLNADGLLDSVRTAHLSYSEEPTAASDGTGSDSSSSNEEELSPARPEEVAPQARRAGSAKDAIFFVLMRCRTGLDIVDLHTLFGLEYSTACRYFALYISFLRVWLESEFPLPTEQQLRDACPESFKVAFPTRNIQYIIDAHEQQCEEPSNLMARRTVWSDYKHRTTNKFLGACTPCGACVHASTNYGGKCDDRTLTNASGLMDTVYQGWTTLADKGFMMHAEFASQKHELLCPTHATANVPTYSVDESKWTNAIGKTRIHIERMFRRAQEWKILHRTIKISNMDLAGTVFKVCCLMGNYEPQLIRERDEVLRTLSEIQWGDV